jgi:hypothetical protein
VKKSYSKNFDRSKSAQALRIDVLVGMYFHIRICRYVVSIQKNALQEIPGGHGSVRRVDSLNEPTELI